MWNIINTDDNISMYYDITRNAYFMTKSIVIVARWWLFSARQEPVMLTVIVDVHVIGHGLLSSVVFSQPRVWFFAFRRGDVPSVHRGVIFLQLNA